ncbi:hypothetical protein M3Y99_01799400 [Aphelenchoides fujianensis]|nr:hypothetical protein M3Y99_01799400 [Aphelenchoides fujianensis]
MFCSVFFLAVLFVCSAEQEVETTTGFDGSTRFSDFPPWCENVDPEFYINEISFGRFSTDSFHDGFVQNDTNWDDYFIYVPTSVLKQIVTILGAQPIATGYSVACDEDSLWSYPDLLIDIESRTFDASPWDYVDVLGGQDDVCTLMISDQSPTSYSVTLPSYDGPYICMLEQGSTPIPMLQSQNKQKKMLRAHRLRRNLK